MRDTLDWQSMPPYVRASLMAGPKKQKQLPRVRFRAGSNAVHRYCDAMGVSPDEEFVVVKEAYHTHEVHGSETGLYGAKGGERQTLHLASRWPPRPYTTREGITEWLIILPETLLAHRQITRAEGADDTAERRA